MIRALLIDDEIANTNNLTAMLRKYCPQVTILGTANTIEQAEDLIIHHRPNLLFLDIQMGSTTGFDLLQNIDKIDFQIIFVTAHNQYGIQAIKHAALDYLLKPIDIDELKQAVAKAEEKINSLVQKSQVEFFIQQWQPKISLPKKIALSFQNETRYIPIVDIVRCEADDTYTIFHLVNEPKIIASRPLKEYTEILTPHGFLRTHQSHLINPRFIKSWLKEDGGTILLTNQVKIPVSKPNRDRIKDALVLL